MLLISPLRGAVQGKDKELYNLALIWFLCFKWHFNLYGLFNIKAILVEE